MTVASQPVPGPLHNLRIVELAGIGPTPYCGQLFADLGADVIRVERPVSQTAEAPVDLLNRGKRTIGVDLKNTLGTDAVLRLVDRADALIEGLRPGVTERLGLGPDVCLGRNPRLVYGRMTGWGQEGPLAGRAGHDINYLALSGTLSAIGTEEKPIVPLNLVADFGGGAMFLAVGVLAALHERHASGRGQVVDAAMVDGVAHLSSMLHSMISANQWNSKRRSNLLDGGAPFYDTYRTADDAHVAVGALEPQFFRQLVDGLGGLVDVSTQYDQSAWPAMRRSFESVFSTRTRDEWEEVFSSTDACVTPVLSPSEAVDHIHNRTRGTFRRTGGTAQPGVAPRFSRTDPAGPGGPGRSASHTVTILEELGYNQAEVDTLLSTQVVR